MQSPEVLSAPRRGSKGYGGPKAIVLYASLVCVGPQCPYIGCGLLTTPFGVEGVRAEVNVTAPIGFLVTVFYGLVDM